MEREFELWTQFHEAVAQLANANPSALRPLRVEEGIEMRALRRRYRPFASTDQNLLTIGRQGENLALFADFLLFRIGAEFVFDSVDEFEVYKKIASGLTSHGFISLLPEGNEKGNGGPPRLSAWVDGIVFEDPSLELNAQTGIRLLRRVVDVMTFAEQVRITQ